MNLRQCDKHTSCSMDLRCVHRISAVYQTMGSFLPLLFSCCQLSAVFTEHISRAQALVTDEACRDSTVDMQHCSIYSPPIVAQVAIYH